MNSPSLTTQSYSQCGGAKLLTEPATDEAGNPPGMTAVVCDACGYELGELAPLSVDAGATLGADEWVPLPDPDVDG